MDFERAVDFVIQSEGGYVFDTHDSGGATKFGISKRAYPHLNIRDLTRQEAEAVYKKDYWDRCRCDELPDILKLPVFDTAVNMGVSASVKGIQKLTGVLADGAMGPMTIRAIEKHNAESLAVDFLTDRVLAYSRMIQFPRYGKGWVRRTIRVLIHA